MKTRLWEDRLKVGKHIKANDLVIPELPEGEVYCCPNGCGECKAVYAQFWTLAEFPKGATEDDDPIDGEYCKVIVASCCQDPEDPLLVARGDDLVGAIGLSGDPTMAVIDYD